MLTGSGNLGDPGSFAKALDWISELLKEKKVFVFDWDGTILDSMGMKSENFARAFCSMTQEKQEERIARRVVESYLRLSGRPRKQIFQQILSIFGMEARQYSFERFNSSFENLNKSNLVCARIFPDALELLYALIGRGVKIYISSSVPPQELSQLVESTLPEPIREGISSVLGSKEEFAKGKGHIRAIMEETGALKNELLVFGDDVADHELSEEAGVDCILVNRSGIPGLEEFKMVNNLIQIKDRLPT